MINKEDYTKKQLEDINKTISVIIDSREQRPHSVVEWCERHNVEYKIQKMDYADYSFYIPENEEFGIEGDIDFDKEIAFEKKGSIDEIIGNFVDRKRIETEFQNYEGELYLLIEGSYEDIVNANYHSKYPAKSALATFHSFCDRYQFKPIFLKEETTTPIFMYYTFYYYLRNRLK